MSVKYEPDLISPYEIFPVVLIDGERHNINLAIGVLATAKIRSFPSFQEEVTDLLLEAMGKHPESNGFLVDGFPASIEQAKICEEKLGKPE